MTPIRCVSNIKIWALSPCKDLISFCIVIIIIPSMGMRAPLIRFCVEWNIFGDCECVWHSFLFFFKYFLLLTSWVLGEWTPCTVTCGDGIQTRDLTCKQEISPTLTMRVNEAACLGTAPSVPRVRNCNLGHCAKWHTSDWGKVRNFFIFFVFVLFEKNLHFSHLPPVIYQRD